MIDTPCHPLEAGGHSFFPQTFSRCNVRNSLVIAFMLILAGMNIQSQTWTSIHGLHRSDIQGLLLHNGILVAPTQYGGVYFSSDNGDTWQSSSMGIEAKEIRSYAADDNYLYVAARYNYGGGEPDSIFRSSDNGRTWQNCKSKYLNTSSYSVPSTLQMIGAVEKKLFLGTAHNTYWSNDNGSSWISIDSIKGVPDFFQDLKAKFREIVAVDTSEEESTVQQTMELHGQRSFTKSPKTSKVPKDYTRSAMKLSWRRVTKYSTPAATKAIHGSDALI